MTRVLRLACLLAMVVLPASAQDWDTARPVRVVVGYAAGGGAFDAVARAIADGLHERLGNPVVVDNRPGAGGGDGQPAEAWIARRDGRREAIRSKLGTVLETGDRLVARTAGAGGWGEAE